MMTLSLPEIDSQGKTQTAHRLVDFGAEVEPERTFNRGSIVIRFYLKGTYSAQISAEESDLQHTLQERYAAARPLLEMLQTVFTADGNGSI
jgi:hypothetical protein